MLTLIVGTVVFLALLVATPVILQDFDKGFVVYQRVDYAAALRELKSLAEEGYLGA